MWEEQEDVGVASILNIEYSNVSRSQPLKPGRHLKAWESVIPSLQQYFQVAVCVLKALSVLGTVRGVHPLSKQQPTHYQPDPGMSDPSVQSWWEETTPNLRPPITDY